MHKREKALKIWSDKRKKLEATTSFIKSVPIDELILINFKCYNKAGEVLLKVEGFNKVSIAVSIIAVSKEHLIHLKGKDGKFLKFKYIVDRAWKKVNEEDLPLYINYEVKTPLFEQLLSEA